jgi:hypothetical protein
MRYRTIFARRTVGNVVEALGIVAFHLSPVWVLAALSDVCGVGRQVIPEIADALKAQGLLQDGRQFVTIDEWDPLPYYDSPKDARRADRVEQLATAAAAEAFEHAGDVGVDALSRRGHQVWQTLKAESARQQRSSVRDIVCDRDRSRA